MIDTIEVADKLRQEGDLPDKTARAIVQAAARLSRLTELKRDMALLKWMVGTNVALTLIVLGKLLIFPAVG